MIRVRFAPSPTGQLHVGNARTALFNWLLAHGHDGTFILRIEDTDTERSTKESEASILEDLRWLGLDWDEGPVLQSTRAQRHREAAAAVGAEDDDGSLRFGRLTLLRPDGTPTFHLASVVDDHDFRITHVVRGSDHRPNEELHAGLARALGFEPPEVVHHGLILGPDGKKLSKRAGEIATLEDLREAGIPAAAVRAYLEELGEPAHDVQLDLPRLRRLAIDAIASMPDEELAAQAAAPVGLARALRGARDLVEAREMARSILHPEPVVLPPEAQPTLTRFVELEASGLEPKALVRELKAVGGDLKALRLALTGRDRGPELWTVIAALPRDEALRRVGAAL
jgi:hypothetical protein